MRAPASRRFSAPIIALTLPLSVVAGCTCGSTPAIQGTVLDPWGSPVEGATVAVEGADNPLVTDRDGTFELPMVSEAALTITADGYIRARTTVAPPDTATAFPTAIELIPTPPKPGFHAIGPESLIALDPEPVVRLGTELAAWQGIRGSGKVELPAGDVRVVFHTPLKIEEIARLDIEVHELEFIEETQMGTVDGAAGVDVDLFVSKAEKPVTRTPLDGRNHLYTVKDLTTGAWAFSTLDLLNASNPAAWDRTPPPIRSVHPFRID